MVHFNLPAITLNNGSSFQPYGDIYVQIFQGSAIIYLERVPLRHWLSRESENININASVEVNLAKLMKKKQIEQTSYTILGLWYSFLVDDGVEFSFEEFLEMVKTALNPDNFISIN